MPNRDIPTWQGAVRNVVRRARVARARATTMGKCCIGPHVVLGPRARWMIPQRAKLEGRIFLGADLFVETNLEIVGDALISSRVSFIGNDHEFESSAESIIDQPRRMPSTIQLMGDNLIGHGTIIIGPATIGVGTIVGAGSLVVGDLPDWSICVGRPARVVRARKVSKDYGVL